MSTTEVLTLDSMRAELVAALEDQIRAMEAVASARDTFDAAKKASERAAERVSTAERNLIGMCVPEGYAERRGQLFSMGAW